MKYALLLLIFSTYSWSQTSIKNCESLKDDCEYYLCLEAQKKCPKTNYLRSFGYKYCTKFKNQFSKNVKPQTQTWMKDVRECLIQKIDELPESKSCEEIGDYAIKSHKSCYQETNFCYLPHKEKIKLIRYLARPSLKNRTLRTTGLNILRMCRWVRWY